jgi:hypothetical protein
MSDLRSEYLPAENSNGNGYHNGNGHANGNGHQKAFNIVPAKEDTTGKILGVRDQVIADTRMDPGARLMFCYLLDQAVREGSYDYFGVVTHSQTYLARVLGCSPRTIWNYKDQLITHGYVWVTLKPMPNMIGMDCYHISILCKRQHADKTTAEGFWGNGSGRALWKNPGLGAREPGQLHLRGNLLRRSLETSKNANLPENAGESGTGLPVSTETGCHGEPKQVATARSNPLPRATETGCHGEPKQVATGNRNRLPRTTETGCQHKKAKAVVKASQSIKGGVPPPESSDDQAFRIWFESLTGSFPSRLEKMRDKFKQQRKQASEAGRELLKRKIAKLDELLDGPQPEWAEPQKKSPAKLDRTVQKIAQAHMSDADLLASAKVAVQNGWSITERQRELLRALSPGEAGL